MAAEPIDNDENPDTSVQFNDLGKAQFAASEIPPSIALPPGMNLVRVSESGTTGGATPAERAAQVAKTDAAIGKLERPLDFQGKAQMAQKLNAPMTDAVKGYKGTTDKALQTQEANDREIVKPALDQMKETEDAYQKGTKARVENRAKIQSQLEQMDTLAKTIAADQPHDIWADASTGLKATSIALMSLGAAAQAFYGDKTNAVTDQIDAAIKRDIMMQRMRLEKGKNDFANKNLLLKQFESTTDHMEHAEDMTYMTAMNGVIGRLKANQSLLTSPAMRANIGKTIAELEMKSADVGVRIMENVVGREFSQANAVAQLQQQREAAMQRGNSAQSLVAAMRERRLGAKAGREQAALQFRGWSPIPDEDGQPGAFNGDPKAAEKFRVADSSMTSALRALDTLRDSVDKGTLTKMSYNQWKEISAEAARAIILLKGDGIGDAGKNFTEMEAEMIKNAYTGADGAVTLKLDPYVSDRILKAEAELMEQLQTAAEKHNLQMDENNDAYDADAPKKVNKRKKK